MSIETFRRNLEAGRAQLRREQRRRAWSLIVGLIAAGLALGLSGSMADIGLPNRVDQWLYVVWVLGAWFGTCSLLAFGAVPEPSPPHSRYMLAGLWAGALAVAVGVSIAPLAIILLLLPVGVGVSIVRRLSGIGYAVLYAALPFLAFLVSVAYQRYGMSAI